jgi:hypothetical protein
MTEEALCSFARRFGGVICDLIGDTLVTSTQLVDFRRYHSGQIDGDRELVTDFVRLLVRTGISLQRAKAERSYEDATVAKVGTSIGLGNSRLVDVGGGLSSWRAMTARASIQEQKTSLKNTALRGGPHRLGHSSKDHSSRQFRNSLRGFFDYAVRTKVL